MKTNFLFLILLCFFFTGKINAQAYSYSDGNSNLYNIAPDKLEYIPVKKENSSSGTYSGGKAKNIKLKHADYSSLTLLFEDAIKLSANHSEKREMGTGLVYKADKAGTEVILKTNSEIKAQIEKKLKEVLK